MTQIQNKLIHVAKEGGCYLFLRKMGDAHFAWFKGDEEIGLHATHVEEAIRLLNCNRVVRMLGCGFRYTLPERDEHGINALFCQMGASYDSLTGVYFEEELGYNCHVQNASDEAVKLWRQLKALGKT